MPISDCCLFKNSYEFRSKSEIATVPVRVRGIYVLFNSPSNDDAMDVVYIGMARGEKSGARGRLIRHKKTKADWTHFSVFEVWDNVTRQQVQELEGLFRHIYCRDRSANKLNVQKSYKPLNKIRRKSQDDWVSSRPRKS